MIIFASSFSVYQYAFASTGGSIKGIVYNDTNGDLIKDGGEKNVPGWNVSLYQNGTLVSSQLTNSTGYFVFSGLVAGKYSLNASLPTPYVITQPLNNTYSITTSSPGDRFLVSFGIYKNPTNLLDGLGDIVSIGPEGLAMDSNGFLYDIDISNNVIKKFNKNGTLVLTISSPGTGKFGNLYGLAIDTNSNIFAVDGASKIYKFNPSGNLLMSFGTNGTGPGNLNQPRGITVDAQGNIFVADGNNNRLQKFDGTGKFLMQIGKPGVPFSYIRLPFDDKLDSNGNIFVANTGDKRIEKFDSNGNYVSTISQIGPSNGKFNFPRNIAIDSNGFLYVSDTYNDKIEIFDKNNNFVRVFGGIGSGPGQFLNPSGIVVDSNGIIYVADSSNDRIESFNNDGTFLSQFRTRSSPIEPYFVNFDSAGNLFVSDGHTHRVLEFNATTGQLLSTIGSLGSGPGQFHGPRGIAFDSQGEMIVGDNYNNRVEKFDRNGNFVMAFGSTGSGPGQFNQPRGVIVDSSGNILVADTQNNRIEKFNNNGNYLASFSTVLPYQIAIDSQGNIYGADEFAEYIEKLGSNGNSLARFGSFGSAPGQVSNPRGVYVDTSGNIYVADSLNNRVQKWDASGNPLKILGSFGINPGQFSDPRGILVDSSGNIWVDDTGNLRIQEFDSNFNFIKQISENFTDTIQPTISISSPANGTIINSSTVAITGTASDTGSGVQKVEVSVDGNAYSLANGTTNWTFNIHSLSNGAHKIFAKTTDNQANVVTANTSFTTNPGAMLTVIKKIINDDGGILTLSGVTLQVNGTIVTNGTANSKAAGNYIVGEVTVPGYTSTISGDCAADGSVTLAPGDNKVCTITNNDNQASLTVIKKIINDNGGTLALSGVTLKIGSTTVTNATANPENAGAYTVSETAIPGYTATFSGDCNTSGQVTLTNGDNKVCTITNDDIKPTINITSVSNSSPRWGLDSVSVSGNVTNAVSGDTVTVTWGDGNSTTGISLVGNSWGPVSHTYSATAISSNPNQIIATWKDNTSAVKASSTSSLVNVQKHKTSIAFGAINPHQYWGRPDRFTATLTDVDNGGTAIQGKTIHFDGTGVIGVADRTTTSFGKLSSPGITPSTVATGWTYQAHFAGDSSYLNFDSTVNTFDTIKHRVSLTLSIQPNSVAKGSPYRVNGTLTDTTASTTLASKIISFSATSPIIINSTVTDSSGSYLISGLIAPNTAGAYTITAKFAGDSLYNLVNSVKQTLSVS